MLKGRFEWHDDNTLYFVGDDGIPIGSRLCVGMICAVNCPHVCLARLTFVREDNKDRLATMTDLQFMAPVVLKNQATVHTEE